MTYSYDRFRKVLAVIRMVFGLIFTYYGATKLFDPQFFSSGYTAAVVDAGEAAPHWYSGVVESLVMYPGKAAIVIGLVQLFLGLCLLLGLATRLASMLGMLYMLNRIVLSWRPQVDNPTLWHYLDAHLLHISLFSLFLIFGLEHAGETWGIGALYHSQRFQRLRSRPAESNVVQIDGASEKDRVSADANV